MGTQWWDDPDWGAGTDPGFNKGQVVHHEKYCEWKTDYFDPPSNLICLCNDCHKTRHRCPSCKGEGMVRSEHIKKGQVICDNCKDDQE